MDSNTSGFIAARRKNVISYFVVNFNADVNKRDSYDYMNFNGVTPTYINLYCGRNGVAAVKVNVHADDQHKVENKHFWPNDIVARLWVKKEEWSKERPFFRQRHQHRHNKTSRYDREDHRDRKHYDERSFRYQPRQHGYKDRRNDWSHDDRYTGSYERHRYNDTFDCDENTASDNEWYPTYDDFKILCSLYFTLLKSTLYL